MQCIEEMRELCQHTVQKACERVRLMVILGQYLQELEQRAEGALHEAKATLESEQNRLLHMAGIVQQFHEQIMQVLPEVPSRRPPPLVL